MILITGGHGQLGTELRHLLDEKSLSIFQQMLISLILPIKRVRTSSLQI